MDFKEEIKKDSDDDLFDFMEETNQPQETEEV
jgi:hypothetical protein